jgi:hypothetical protein
MLPGICWIGVWLGHTISLQVMAIRNIPDSARNRTPIIATQQMEGCKQKRVWQEVVVACLRVLYHQPCGETKENKEKLGLSILLTQPRHVTLVLPLELPLLPSLLPLVLPLELPLVSPSSVPAVQFMLARSAWTKCEIYEHRRCSNRRPEILAWIGMSEVSYLTIILQL